MKSFGTKVKITLYTLILILAHSLNIFAQSDCFDVSWQKLFLGDLIGAYGSVIDDVDNDGIIELVSYSTSVQMGNPTGVGYSFLYALEFKEQQTGYKVDWVSEVYGSDNANRRVFDIKIWEKTPGQKEIIALFQDAQVCTYDGNTYENLDCFSVGDLLSVSELDIADADNDGQLDLVVVYRGQELRLYDLQTHQLKKSYTLSPQEFFGCAIGNVDNDPNLEIVFEQGIYEIKNGVMNLEWYNSPTTNGISLKLGDIDGDGIQEIFGLSRDNTYIIATSALSNQQLKTWYNDFYLNFTIYDVNQDGKDELIFSKSYQDIVCISPQTDSIFWTIFPGGTNGATGMTIGDVDNDGELELVANSGIINSSDSDTLNIYDLKTQQIEYKSDGNYGGDLSIFYADPNNDGTKEVALLQRSHYSWVEPGRLLSYFNFETGLSTASVDITSILPIAYEAKVIDIDEDGRQELLIIGSYSVHPTPGGTDPVYSILVFDAQTFDLKTKLQAPFGISFYEAKLIYEDNIPKLITGSSHPSGHLDEPEKLYKYNLRTGEIEMSAPVTTLDFNYRDFYAVEYGDVTGDGIKDYIGTRDQIVVVDGATKIYHEFCHEFLCSLRALALVNLDGDDILDILVGDDEGNLRGFSGKSNQEIMTFMVGSSPVTALKVIPEVPDIVFIFQNGRLHIFDLIRGEIICRSSRIATDYTGLLNRLEYRIEGNKLYFLINSVYGPVELIYNGNIISTIDRVPAVNFKGRLFPNPVKEFLNIELELPRASNVEYRLVDLFGRIWLQELNINDQLDLSKKISISHLPPGLYYLTIFFEEIKRSFPIVILPH